jgi:hypothetical protein
MLDLSAAAAELRVTGMLGGAAKDLLRERVGVVLFVLGLAVLLIGTCCTWYFPDLRRISALGSGDRWKRLPP